jgi:hypothetical protein
MISHHHRRKPNWDICTIKCVGKLKILEVNQQELVCGCDGRKTIGCGRCNGVNVRVCLSRWGARGHFAKCLGHFDRAQFTCWS